MNLGEATVDSFIAEMLQRGGGRARIVLEDGALAEVASHNIAYSAGTARLYEQAKAVRHRSDGMWA